MRCTRLGAIANRNNTYTWEVYNLAYGIDESSAQSGSVTMSSSYTKQASTTYTASSDGFTLVNSVATSVGNLANKYIVNIASRTDTQTSGTYIYYVDSVQKNVTVKINYTRYSAAKNQKGTATGQRVKSKDISAYPANGIQGNYWYVLRA